MCLSRLREQPSCRVCTASARLYSALSRSCVKQMQTSRHRRRSLSAWPNGCPLKAPLRAIRVPLWTQGAAILAQLAWPVQGPLRSQPKPHAADADTLRSGIKLCCLPVSGPSRSSLVSLPRLNPFLRRVWAYMAQVAVKSLQSYHGPLSTHARCAPAVCIHDAYMQIAREQLAGRSHHEHAGTMATAHH